MSELDDPRLAAVERLLTGRAGHAAPAGHRDRVLAAVRDTLEGRVIPMGTPVGIDAGGMAALVAMAVSALVVIVAPWCAVTRSAAAMPTEPLFVVQARAAGIDLPMAVVAASRRPSREPLSRAGTGDLLERRPNEAWRMRDLLQGEL